MEEANAIMVLALLLIAVCAQSLVKRTRKKAAFKFGKIEHVFARITFVFLVLGLGLLIIGQEEVALYVILLSGTCWIVYWISHRLEKWFHPEH